MRSRPAVPWSCAALSLILAVIGSPLVARAESDSKTVRVSATILPRLELSVSPETGDQLAFGAIEQPAPGEAVSKSVKVRLNVFSNLGRPYHVTQTVRRGLTNAEGHTIPEAQFQLTTSEAARGELGVPTPTVIIPGAVTTLYTSDPRGKSDAFSADYTLTVTPQTSAGDFDTEIVYTVTGL